MRVLAESLLRRAKHPQSSPWFTADARGAGSGDVKARAIRLTFHRFIHNLQRAIDDRKPLTKLPLIDG